MHQNAFVDQAPPQTHWGSLSAPQTSSGSKRGKERWGKGEGRKMGRGTEGRMEKRKESMKGGMPPPTKVDSLYLQHQHHHPSTV